MFKLSKIQADAISRRISETIRTNRDEKKRKVIENIYTMKEFSELYETVSNIINQLKSVDPKNQDSYIHIFGKYFYSFAEGNTVKERLAEYFGIEHKMFDDETYISCDAIADDLLIASVMNDDVETCIKSLVEKYS